MARRKTLSDLGIVNLKPKAARYTAPDPECRGLYIRVMPSRDKKLRRRRALASR